MLLYHTLRYVTMYRIQTIYATYTFDEIVGSTPANKSLTITVSSEAPSSNALVFFTSEVRSTTPLTWHTSVNPLMPTVVIWVQLQSILCQTGLSRHL